MWSKWAGIVPSSQNQNQIPKSGCLSLEEWLIHIHNMSWNIMNPLTKIVKVLPVDLNIHKVLLLLIIIIIILIVFGSGYKEELGKWKVTWPCPSFVAFCDFWMEHEASPTPLASPHFQADHPSGRCLCLGVPPRPLSCFLSPSCFCVTAHFEAVFRGFSRAQSFLAPKASPHPLCVHFLTKWSRPGSPTLGQQTF